MKSRPLPFRQFPVTVSTSKSARRRASTGISVRLRFALQARAAALSLGALALLFAPASRAAVDTWVGSTSANFNTLFGFNAVPQNGDTLVFGPAGAAGTTINNNLTGLSVGGAGTDGIDFLISASPFTITGNAITLASSGAGIGINDLALNAQTVSAPVTLASSQSVNVGSFDGALTLSGVVSGAGFTLTKTGAGLLTLTGGTNTFSNLTVTGGTVAAGGDGNFGSTTGTITLDGGALRTTGGITLSATRGISLGDVAAGTGGTIDTSGNGVTYGGILANNGGANSFTKVGNGTLLLTGTNTYTGATIITGGTLSLDFNTKGSTTPTINAASTLTFGGATPAGFLGTASSQEPTLTSQTLGSASTTQTFAGLTLNAATGNLSARGVNANNMTLVLGGITRNAGGSINFSQLTSGSTGAGVFTTTTANGTVANATGGTSTGILGGWAVTNAAPTSGTNVAAPTDYAANNGAGSIVTYAGYTPIATGATIAGAAASNVRVTATGTIALSTGVGTTDINTLSLAPAATGATTLTQATGGVLRLGASGGLLTGSGSGILTIGSGANNGTLTAGGADNTPGEIILQVNQQIVLNSTLADNGTGAVSLSVNAYSAPSGNNSVVIAGSNTYSGGTFLNSGRTLANTNTAFGSGAVTIAPGAQAYLNSPIFANNFNISGAGGGTGGFDTPAAIRMQGGQTLSGTITLLGDAYILGGGTDTLGGRITGGYNLFFGRGGGGGAGAGTVILANTSANANNYRGNTTLTEGTLQLGASNQIPDGAGYGNLVLSGSINNNATFNLAGFNETVNGLNGTATVGSGTVTNTTGTSILTVGGNDQSSTFNGLITQNGNGTTLGLAKTGAGLLVLGDVANAYSGGTTVSGGTLRLTAASGTTNSELGTITGALTVNTGGTLDLNSFSQTVGSLAGTGGLVTSSVTGTPTLTVGVAGGTASTVFAGSLQNGAATSLGLTVQGNTLDLTGVNTYTGATNVTGGALQLGTGGSIANTSGIALSGTGGFILGDAGGAVSSTINGNFTTTATSFVAGGATTNSTLTLNGPGTTTYANAFGGTGTNQNNLNLIIAGTGTTPTTIFSGTSTYTGTTTVNGGATLNISGSLGNTAVTVNSGAILTGGNANVQVIGGNLTVAGGGALTLTNTASFFSVGGNAMLGGTGAYAPGNYATLTFTLGGSNAAEPFNVNGNLTLGSGGVFVNVTNPSQTGTFNLANYGGNPTGFSLSSTTAGVLTQNVGRNTETLTSGGGALTLTISGAATPATAYFNGSVSSVWNDLSNATRVNFSSNLAGTTDAGNIPGATTDVILNATNAPANRGTSTLSETLGASTSINSLSVNNVGTTTLAADGSTLTINAAGGTVNAPGVGLVIVAGANPFTINPPLALGGDQSWTNNSASLFTVGGTVTGLATAANTLTLANTGAGGTTVNGVIANGSGGTLALVVSNTGAGVTTLNGANTYGGGTTLTAGTLTVTAAGGLGTGFVSVDPTQNAAPAGTAADNATLNSTGSIASTAAVTVNSRTDDGAFGVGTLNFNGATPSIGSLAGTGNGKVVLNNAGGTTLTVGNNNTSTAFSGVISNGAGTGSLVKVGTGILDLTGANSYTGTTTVQNGTLQIGGGGSLTATSVVTLGNGTTSGVLALGDGNGAVNQTLVGLAVSGTGTGNAVVGGAGAVSTLTINIATASSYSGVLGGTGTNQNNLKLSDAGPGILTLGSTNSYVGGTSVSTGATLIDNSAASNGLGSGTVTVASGGLVQINSTASPTVNEPFAGSGTVKFNFPGGGSDTEITATTFNGFTGIVEIANPGNTNNKLVFRGQSGVSGATLQIDNGGQAFIASGTTNFGAITVIGTGNGEGRGAIRLNAGTLGGNISLLGNATVGNEGGTLTGNISAGVAGTQTLTMGTGNSNGTATLSGVLGDGAGQLALAQSNGTTTLSGANTYTGATVVTGGSLVLANSLAVQNSTVTPGGAGVVFSSAVASNAFTAGGLAGSGNLALQNNATAPVGVALTLSNAAAVSNAYAGVLSGPGSLVKAGASTQVLGGANTYAGTTTVSAGTLLFNGNNGGATGAVAVNNTGTLGGTGGTLGGATTVNSGGSITGGTVGTVGMLTITSSLALTNGSTYLVDVGTGNASDLLTSNTLLSSGATVRINSGTLDGTDTYTIATYGSDAGSTFVLANAPGYTLRDTGTSLQLVPAAVPEPSTWAGMALLGALGLGLRRFRRASAPVV